jgi:exodeoxyribonuclease V alpha subunit
MRKNNIYLYEEYFWIVESIFRYLKILLTKKNLFAINNNSLNELELIEKKYKSINDEQLNIIKNILTKNNISLIIGMGGTGKTSFIISPLCNYLSQSKNNYIYFLAPTHSAKNNGRKNINIDSDNISYQTIQYIIFLDKLKKDLDDLVRNNKDINVFLIIDEFSMVNNRLFCKLLENCICFIENNNSLKIILLGDNNQLPPIGCGNLLTALIDKIPTYKLTKNFRVNENNDLINFLNTILGKGVSGKFWSLKKNKFNNVEYHFTDKPLIILKNIINKLKLDKIYQDVNNDKKSFQVISPYNETCKLLTPIIRNSNTKNLYVSGDIIIMKKNTKFFKNGNLGKIVNINENNNYKIKLNEIVFDCNYIEQYNDLLIKKKSDILTKNEKKMLYVNYDYPSIIYSCSDNIVTVSDVYFKTKLCDST